MKICDTSVLVDIDRGNVTDRVDRLDDEGRHAISVVTETELRFGVSLQYDTHSEAHETAIEALQRLLARFDVEPVSRPVARVAGDIMGNLQEMGAELNDLHDIYIAGTAIVESVPVLTANVDHFDRIEDVSVIDWSSY